MLDGSPRTLHATAAPAPVAVFDMDGVLVHGDVFGSFVRHRLRRSPVHAAAVAGISPWLVPPMLLPPTRARAVRQLLRLALAGLDEPTYEHEARRFAARLAGRADRVVHQAVEAAHELHASGHRIVIATACEERIASAYITALGLSAAQVIGSRIEFRRTGPRAVHSNHGAHKVAALQAAGFGPTWDVAYSDALSDVPLLRGARRAVLVNPDDWLRSRVTRQLGRVADEVQWPEMRLTRADRRTVR